MGEPIDCREAKERLTDYLKQELTPELAGEVHEHLVRCRSCFSRARFEETLAKHSTTGVDQVRKDIERDKILTAQESVDYGLVDRILSSRRGD